MSDEKLLAKSRAARCADSYIRGDASEFGPVLFDSAEQKGYEGRTRFDGFEAELAGEMVGESARTDFGNR